MIAFLVFVIGSFCALLVFTLGEEDLYDEKSDDVEISFEEKPKKKTKPVSKLGSSLNKDVFDAIEKINEQKSIERNIVEKNSDDSQNIDGAVSVLQKSQSNEDIIYKVTNQDLDPYEIKFTSADFSKEYKYKLREEGLSGPFLIKYAIKERVSLLIRVQEIYKDIKFKEKNRKAEQSNGNDDMVRKFDIQIEELHQEYESLLKAKYRVPLKENNNAE